MEHFRVLTYAGTQLPICSINAYASLWQCLTPLGYQFFVAKTLKEANSFRHYPILLHSSPGQSDKENARKSQMASKEIEVIGGKKNFWLFSESV